MQTWARHAFFWATIYLLWSYMKSSGNMDLVTLLFTLVNLIVFMMVYYLLKHVQIPYLYNQGKSFIFILSILLFSFIFFGVWMIGVSGLCKISGPVSPCSDLTKSLGGYLIETIQFYSPAVILLAWESHNEHLKEKDRLQQLEKEKMQSELKFLKAQINPHFLFNTLNNLYSYVVNESPKAPDIIIQLSGILDYVLYKSQCKTVALNDEVNTIEQFVELEQIRYGDRLGINFQRGENMTLPISPLILLSLVENAFKHGASGDIDSPKIKIDIKEKNKSIYCEVWNTKSNYEGELNDAYKEGIGLSNIKRQLNLIYPENHELIIRDEEAVFNVLLIIKPVV